MMSDPPTCRLDVLPQVELLVGDWQVARQWPLLGLGQTGEIRSVQLRWSVGRQGDSSTDERYQTYAELWREVAQRLFNIILKRAM